MKNYNTEGTALDNTRFEQESYRYGTEHEERLARLAQLQPHVLLSDVISNAWVLEEYTSPEVAGALDTILSYPPSGAGLLSTQEKAINRSRRQLDGAQRRALQFKEVYEADSVRSARWMKQLSGVVSKLPQQTREEIFPYWFEWRRLKTVKKRAEPIVKSGYKASLQPVELFDQVGRNTLSRFLQDEISLGWRTAVEQESPAADTTRLGELTVDIRRAVTASRAIIYFFGASSVRKYVKFHQREIDPGRGLFAALCELTVAEYGKQYQETIQTEGSLSKAIDQITS